MPDKQISQSADVITEAADSLKSSAQSVEDVTEAVQRAASSVQSNVAEGIQPDIRELRIYISEINELTSVKIKRLTWAIYLLVALNLIQAINILVG